MNEQTNEERFSDILNAVEVHENCDREMAKEIIGEYAFDLAMNCVLSDGDVHVPDALQKYKVEHARWVEIGQSFAMMLFGL